MKPTSASHPRAANSFIATSMPGEVLTKLILYHQMFLGGPDDTAEGMLNEIRQTTKGKVVSAHDLEIY